VNLRQVNAEHGVQRGTHIKAEAVWLFGSIPCGGQWRSRGLRTGLKVLEGEFDTLITLCDPVLEKIVQRESLGQLEYVLGLVVATQRLTDRFGGGLATHIAMLGEDIGIALAGYDGPDDLQPVTPVMS
jgi:hypothetical protein